MPSNSDLKRELSAQMKKELVSKDKFFPDEPKPNRKRQVFLGLVGATVLIASGSLGYVAGKKSASVDSMTDEQGVTERSLLRGAEDDTTTNDNFAVVDNDMVDEGMAWPIELPNEPNHQDWAPPQKKVDEETISEDWSVQTQYEPENTQDTEAFLAAVEQSFYTRYKDVPMEDTTRNTMTSTSTNDAFTTEDQQPVNFFNTQTFFNVDEQPQQDQDIFYDAQEAPAQEQFASTEEFVPTENVDTETENIFSGPVFFSDPFEGQQQQQDDYADDE